MHRLPRKVFDHRIRISEPNSDNLFLEQATYKLIHRGWFSLTMANFNKASRVDFFFFLLDCSFNLASGRAQFVHRPNNFLYGKNADVFPWKYAHYASLKIWEFRLPSSCQQTNLFGLKNTFDKKTELIGHLSAILHEDSKNVDPFCLSSEWSVSKAEDNFLKRNVKTFCFPFCTPSLMSGFTTPKIKSSLLLKTLLFLLSDWILRACICKAFEGKNQ